MFAGSIQPIGRNYLTEKQRITNKKSEKKLLEKSLPARGSIAVLNPNQIIDQLIELGRFAKIL